MSSPTHFLDTNTCIYIINKKPPQVAEVFGRHQIGDVALSSVTVAELAFGAAKSVRKGTRETLEEFLLDLMILPFDEAAAWVYGDLRARLQATGQTIGPLDMQIAAHALSAGVTLVTHNTGEFARVSGLKLENWFPE
ncbi:type II toxin-antitoxin system tRNA(fMet)-specific endonuclease VapC [Deinococcus arenicola]|uniref:Ribonuclease VapC n=1 Tax=Deinococcus arenicola TaxID=2994950 RepID=A0ABU4DTB5_9DEIO|nr:type II toxin-antitoxin system VapC family toxin [Deinococcus sp. ZS9-10]MDV6375683.1 type II toxin-antitoxin system VapC family toxin [Deinococcus sp. ZS9-10]